VSIDDVFNFTVQYGPSMDDGVIMRYFGDAVTGNSFLCGSTNQWQTCLDAPITNYTCPCAGIELEVVDDVCTESSTELVEFVRNETGCEGDYTTISVEFVCYWTNTDTEAPCDMEITNVAHEQSGTCSFTDTTILCEDFNVDEANIGSFLSVTAEYDATMSTVLDVSYVVKLLADDNTTCVETQIFYTCTIDSLTCPCDSIFVVIDDDNCYDTTVDVVPILRNDSCTGDFGSVGIDFVCYAAGTSSEVACDMSIVDVTHNQNGTCYFDDTFVWCGGVNLDEALVGSFVEIDALYADNIADTVDVSYVVTIYSDTNATCMVTQIYPDCIHLEGECACDDVNCTMIMEDYQCNDHLYRLQCVVATECPEVYVAELTATLQCGDTECINGTAGDAFSVTSVNGTCAVANDTVTCDAVTIYQEPTTVEWFQYTFGSEFADEQISFDLAACGDPVGSSSAIEACVSDCSCDTLSVLLHSPVAPACDADRCNDFVFSVAVNAARNPLCGADYHTMVLTPWCNNGSGFDVCPFEWFTDRTSATSEGIVCTAAPSAVQTTCVGTATDWTGLIAPSMDNRVTDVEVRYVATLEADSCFAYDSIDLGTVTDYCDDCIPACLDNFTVVQTVDNETYCDPAPVADGIISVIGWSDCNATIEFVTTTVVTCQNGTDGPYVGCADVLLFDYEVSIGSVVASADYDCSEEDYTLTCTGEFTATPDETIVSFLVNTIENQNVAIDTTVSVPFHYAEEVSTTAIVTADTVCGGA
jgi:hypothetical protein